MKRFKHSLSHYKLVTGLMGKLIPIACFEVLPGDSIQQATSLLLRALPLNAPVMHPVSVRIHHWFVPNRIMWDGWEAFITGGADGTNSDTPPYKALTTVPESSLTDYLGVPTGAVNQNVSALPYRAYAMIFNEHYRDQDLVSEAAVVKTSGADTGTSTDLLSVAWEKDQNTTARPWPQKGPDVTLPLGTSAPVDYVHNDTGPWYARDASTGSVYTPGVLDAMTVNTSGHVGNSSGAVSYQLDPGNNLQVDLSLATAVDVNTVREAFALQRYQEARARYGSRYTEYLRYLGVRSSDARLQRPEYLGGGKQTIAFSEVLQTGVTTSGATEGVGNLRGHGLAAMRSNRYRRFFEEHGLVLTLMSVRPRTMYPQGLEKMWSRQTKEEFYQRELEMIGQEEVKNREVYALDSGPSDTFGWQDRYYSYKQIFSKVSGAFRSTLDHWHLARLFTGDVTLNSSFVTCNPSARIFQVTSGDNLLVMASHSIQARRLVSKSNQSRIM